MSQINSPKVCVLLAAYNGSKFLEEQLRSILKQTNVDVDVYIRLDPSTDDSEAVIKSIAEIHKNVYLLDSIHPSGSAGQNFFKLLIEVNFERYDYIAFADQDDLWFKSKLSRAIECLVDQFAEAYSGNVIAWWADGKEKLVRKSSPQQEFDYLFESAGPGCTFVLKQDLAIEIQKFLVSLGGQLNRLWLHDWFCYAFARSQGFIWYIDSKPMMNYRQHDQNVVGANSGVTAFISRVKEVITGSAFDKVLEQASLLNLNDKKPIQYIREDNFISMLKLSCIALKCRRKLKDKLLFILALLILATKKGLS